MKKQTISFAGKKAGVNIETIRFYQRKELLDVPKTEGAYREYSEDYIKKIKFIKNAQELGFSLKEIKELISLSPENCEDARCKVEKKIIEVNEQITKLNKLKLGLEKLYNDCLSKRENDCCPILKSLST
ncbi:MAG: MerR family transcriptional regulator [Planctomycetota bacterium]|nr:MAG: MerR family transcriptional regulator [Planctomycetota bacterium]